MEFLNNKDMHETPLLWGRPSGLPPGFRPALRGRRERLQSSTKSEDVGVTDKGLINFAAA